MTRAQASHLFLDFLVATFITTWPKILQTFARPRCRRGGKGKRSRGEAKGGLWSQHIQGGAPLLAKLAQMNKCSSLCHQSMGTRATYNCRSPSCVNTGNSPKSVANGLYWFNANKEHIPRCTYEQTRFMTVHFVEQASPDPLATELRASPVWVTFSPQVQPKIEKAETFEKRQKASGSTFQKLHGIEARTWGVKPSPAGSMPGATYVTDARMCGLMPPPWCLQISIGASGLGSHPILGWYRGWLWNPAPVELGGLS